MKILCIAAFDPASVVLSHRDLMRAAGHDFRLAVVRAYTERQQSADYVLYALHRSPVTPGVWSFSWEPQNPNLDELREFAASADVIQFHPGIGMGDGDWASQEGKPRTLVDEYRAVLSAFGLTLDQLPPMQVYFVHGSRATRANVKQYQMWLRGPIPGLRVAASTIDYAVDLNAVYLPPFVDVGDLCAPLRQDDDPLVIAHTPTDRVACSTEAFLEAAQRTGAVVRLGEGLPHAAVLSLKAECNAGFDHLRGAFSVNTLENCALGLAPIFRLEPRYLEKMWDLGIGEIDPWLSTFQNADQLPIVLQMLAGEVHLTRNIQRSARSWWYTHFSAARITERLLKFYEGL